MDELNPYSLQHWYQKRSDILEPNIGSASLLLSVQELEDANARWKEAATLCTRVGKCLHRADVVHRIYDDCLNSA